MIQTVERILDSIVILELMALIKLVGAHIVNSEIQQGMCASCSELLSLPGEILTHLFLLLSGRTYNVQPLEKF